LTTHYREEVEAADDVAVIDRGRLIAQGSPNEPRRACSDSQPRPAPSKTYSCT
jgi:ABC-type multidrug transport system ATPase subunit